MNQVLSVAPHPGRGAPYHQLPIISDRVQQDNTAHLTSLVTGVTSQPTVQVSRHCLVLPGIVSSLQLDIAGCHWPLA
ncbi:hypothetical protein RRG08_023784 [Elysia crispata]|uniref:Uncharacterized protein n=1 Tax=Elysia crispata TaxID=231223 RepID=A0AAE1DN32_9GAST|nr:hypothetical protein RRG08_023784 [Elysia crispata]